MSCGCCKIIREIDAESPPEEKLRMAFIAGVMACGVAGSATVVSMNLKQCPACGKHIEAIIEVMPVVIREMERTHDN